MSKFLRTFCHTDYRNNKTFGGLCRLENGVVVFVHSCGYFEVSEQFVAYHDSL